MRMISQPIIFFIIWSSPTSANACFTHSSPILVPVSAQVGGTSASSAGLMTVTGCKGKKALDMDHKVNDWWQSYGHYSTIIFSMLIIFFIIKFLMLTQCVCLLACLLCSSTSYCTFPSFQISTKLSEYWLHTPQVFEVIVVNMCCTGCTQALLLPG